jgi:plasmid stabilization system protein ParE
VVEWWSGAAGTTCRSLSTPSKLRDARLTLNNLPERGRRVAEFDDPSVREVIVDSYRLIYRVRSQRITVLAFVHKSRDLGALLGAELKA